MQNPIIHGPSRRLLRMGRVARPIGEAPPVEPVLARDVLRKTSASPGASMPFPELAQPCFDRMLLNDRISDCTTVTTMKCAAAILGAAGTRTIFANAQADAFYRGSTGYDGTPATDNGGIVDDVIDYCIAHGIEKNLHHFAGKLLVDGTNPDEVRCVVDQTGNLFLGMCLADDWLQAPNGSVLAYAGGPNPENGHAVPVGGRAGFYTADGLVLTLWGGIEVLMPWLVLPHYMDASAQGEMHSMISRDMLKAGTQETSSGINWAEVGERFKALGGTLA